MQSQDPLERKKQEWSKSDVFYATRKLLIDVYDYKDEDINRKHLTENIREECLKLHVTREEIGIIAADRAQLYFKRQWHDVGLDELDALVEYGTDMVIVEKEGIIMQISVFSNDKRIALLNTRGFSVDYASRLAKLASEKGCNISIVVDWDVSGLLIFLKLRMVIPSIKRIGVDKNTVKKLGLKNSTVEESYKASNNHLKPLKEILYKLYYLARENNDSEKEKEYEHLITNLPDLETTRIEINSITSQLKDNQRFWELIEHGVRKAFPHRNFTRSYTILEYVQPVHSQN